MASGIVRGALAGAAGTAALNAVTYADMAVRGRPSSSSPQQVVERSADRLGVEVPGNGDRRDNRLEGLGPLAGTGVGVVVGALAGRLHNAFAKRGKRIPAPVEIALITAAAMALTDLPMKALGISDPKDWSRTDWLSDAVPHLVYGIVTYGTLRVSE